jgi:hypothetical protein
MPTPDGISNDDWNRVRELATDLINATHTDAEPACRNQLMGYLADLESQYGELPSILATRADFTDDDRARQALLHRAYALASARGDAINALYVAHSLAEHYIQDVKSIPGGRKWLDCFGNLLLAEADRHYDEDHTRLSAGLTLLERDAARDHPRANPKLLKS